MSTTSTEFFDDRPVGDYLVLEVIIAYRKNKALDFPEASELSNREFEEVSQHMVELQLPISPPRQRASTIRNGEVRFYWETKVGSSLHRALYDRLDKRSKNVLWRRPKEKAAMSSNRIQFIKFNRLENLDQLTLADSYEQRERSPYPLPRRLSMVSRIEQSQSLLARIMHSSGSPPSHHQDTYRSPQDFRTTTPPVSHDPFPRYNYQEDASLTPNSYEPQTPPPPSRPTSPGYRHHTVPNFQSNRPLSFDADHDGVGTGYSQFDRDIQTQCLDGHPDDSSLLSRIEPDAHSHLAISNDGCRENSPYSSENMDKEIIVIEDSNDDLVEEVQEEADPEEAESQTTCSPMPVHYTYGNLYASQAGRPVNDISNAYNGVEPEQNVEDLDEPQGPEIEEHHDVQDNQEFSELQDEQLGKRKRALEDADSQQYTYVSGSDDDIHLQEIETQPRISWPWPSPHPQRSSSETNTTVPRSRTTETSKRRRFEYSHPGSNSDYADIEPDFDGETISTSTVDDLRHQLQQEKLATLDARRRWSIAEDLKSKAERELKEARDGQEALKKRVEALEKEKKAVEEGMRAAEAERNVIEAILKDVQKECKDPFVVPALLEAFVTVSGLAMGSQGQGGEGDSSLNSGGEDSSGGKIWQRILQRLQAGADRDHDLEGSGN